MPLRGINTNLSSIRGGSRHYMHYLATVVAVITFAMGSMNTNAQDIEPPINQDYAPIKKTTPIYPELSQYNGVEGECVVAYTVTIQGTIEDPYPEYCSPIGLFEAASIESALEFVYRPRIVDGVAKDVPGVQTKFTFELKGGGKRLEVGPEPVMFTNIKERRLKVINKRIANQDWAGLKKYALGKKQSNSRFLFYEGLAEVMMNNPQAGYDLMEQFVFKNKEPPFEYVTFSAVKLLARHYYESEQYQKLIELDNRVNIWLFRLLEPRETNRIALLIADAYSIQGEREAAVKRFRLIVDRAGSNPEKYDPFVKIAMRALEP